MEATNRHIGSSWEDYQNENMTKKEISASKARAKLMCQLISIREEQEKTQKDISKETGIAQSVISKMETGKTSPRLDTLVNALAVMGYHLEIVANK